MTVSSMQEACYYNLQQFVVILQEIIRSQMCKIEEKKSYEIELATLTVIVL